MSKVGYNFAYSSNPRKKVSNIVNNKERDLTETQKKLKKHDYRVNNDKARLGFIPNAPVKISSKAKNASTQHINVSIKQDQEEPKSTSRTSVFDRMNRSRPRTSALDRIGALERRKDNRKFSGNRETSSNEEKLDRLAEKCDIRSSIPSRMKRQAILEVDENGPLKVRRRTIIHTGQSSCQQAQEDDTEEEVQDVFHITIQEGKEDEIPKEDVTTAPPQLKDGGQAIVDDLKELNLGTKNEQKPIFVSALLSADEIKEYYQLLSEYKDVFAWTYKEMPGLDHVIAVHHLTVKPRTRPIKQTQRRYRSELIPQIEAEIGKLIEAGFIRENDFPLPIIEIMVDATTGHEALSFMDGSSRYNQIRMALENKELTAFRTPKGIYCYKVMPFGLKNAEATYQRAMQKIFNDMLHKNVECYVDDVVVKTKKRLDHLKDLRIVFEKLQKYNLKMNPLKCAFGVTSGKFLDFIVKHRGNEVDQ
ncbi:hypothetical protein EV2_038916 [Malus domestica]